MSDFEMASINAFKEVFPNLKQKGCHFHFSQCIWRKIQQIQYMAQKYISDSTFALQIWLLLALAYVPENHVIDAFEELIDSQYYTDNENFLQPLIDYFEDTWVGRPIGRRKGRRLPKYSISISLWNCYESASTLLPRTNNAVEGWHRGFSSLLGAYHPTLWIFIDVLKDQQHLEDIKQEQFIAGAKKHKKKKKIQRLFRKHTATALLSSDWPHCALGPYFGRHDRNGCTTDQYFWMKRYVKQHIQMCLDCLTHKRPADKKPGLLHPIPFEIVHVDHLGPFETSTAGNRYLLVLVDNLTKYVQLYPCRFTDTGGVVKRLIMFCDEQGIPKPNSE
ncbi:uncharacterized protein LOC111033655 [Myzus persicae]|uniref:uncharacterized protein LOC111033655 n=1 Tax=Myzus persicae TaxID=13164 RepID=UPI000B931562|nr:uncharacterized protein LOC111033655 [Myzus persicae]